ncbi:MAG: hypothetical protein PHQ14_02645 [Chromatiales bacterium]|jgi:hypothetical protein|nr:hypothetical protein [Chromatiales bacterium]MDX9766289.1 hypothetical protein [Ectothiorhodospiraceae bacterium]
MHIPTWRLFWLPISFLLLLLLSGCNVSVGNSDDDSWAEDDSTSGMVVLSGTAAVGAPLSGVVQVVDALGRVSEMVSIGSDGKFSVEVQAAPPFLLRASGGGTVLYSFASQSGVVNITPMTTLATFLAADGANLDGLFAGWNGQIGQAAIDQAMATVNANLAGLLQAYGLSTAYDFFDTAFSADGSGIDAVLDAIDIVIHYGAGSLAQAIQITLPGNVPLGFNPGAGAPPQGGGTLSGNGATGTVNGTTYTITEEVSTAVMLNGTFVFVATDWSSLSFDRWSIMNFDFMPGTQQCDGNKGIQLFLGQESTMPYTSNDCVVEILSVGSEAGFAKSVEGRFTGSFRRPQPGASAYMVSDGHFRFDLGAPTTPPPGDGGGDPGNGGNGIVPADSQWNFSGVYTISGASSAFGPITVPGPQIPQSEQDLETAINEGMSGQVTTPDGYTVTYRYDELRYEANIQGQVGDRVEGYARGVYTISGPGIPDLTVNFELTYVYERVV